MSAPRGIASETIVRLRSVPVERTPQRLDPLGVQSAWLLVPLIGATAIGYAITSTIWHLDQLRSPTLAVTAIAFVMFRYVGDPVAMMSREDASPAEKAELRASLGLDRPAIVQYGDFLGRTAVIPPRQFKRRAAPW